MGRNSGYLDIETIAEKSIPLAELKHVIIELQLLLRSGMSGLGIRKSVIDVALILLASDVAIQDFKRQLKL